MLYKELSKVIVNVALHFNNEVTDDPECTTSLYLKVFMMAAYLSLYIHRSDITL